MPWGRPINTNEYYSWAGLAFEVICHKHSYKIAEKLGLQHIHYNVSSWRYVPPKGSKEKGAQIDLIFDRSDGIISLIEIKYSADVFVITKEYAENLRNKIDIFSKKIKTKKQIVIDFVSLYGLKRNIWSEGLIHNDISLD